MLCPPGVRVSLPFRRQRGSQAGDRRPVGLPTQPRAPQRRPSSPRPRCGGARTPRDPHPQADSQGDAPRLEPRGKTAVSPTETCLNKSKAKPPLATSSAAVGGGRGWAGAVRLLGRPSRRGVGRGREAKGSMERKALDWGAGRPGDGAGRRGTRVTVERQAAGADPGAAPARIPSPAALCSRTPLRRHGRGGAGGGDRAAGLGGGGGAGTKDLGAWGAPRGLRPWQRPALCSRLTASRAWVWACGDKGPARERVAPRPPRQDTASQRLWACVAPAVRRARPAPPALGPGLRRPFGYTAD